MKWAQPYPSEELKDSKKVKGKPMTIRFLSEKEINQNLELVCTLNPEIPRSVLEQRLKGQLQEGYRCVGLFHKDICQAIAGLRVGTRFFCGKFLDVDTVVVRPEARSQGLGKQLMDWIHEYARAEKCDVAVLDAYVENEKAHRFYTKEGYTKKGYHFLKILNEKSPLGCHA